MTQTCDFSVCLHSLFTRSAQRDFFSNPLADFLLLKITHAIGRSRSKDKSEVSGRVLTQLTTEIENLEDGNLVVSTTNFPKMLDGALRRRFSKKFKVPLPDEERRLELLKLFLKGK